MRIAACLFLLACARPPTRTVVLRPHVPPPPVASVARAPVSVEIERRLVAAFLERLTADGYGPLHTDVRPKSVPPLLTLEIQDMSWHGNHVGDRWKQARVTCATCDGYEINLIDLFDLNIARFDVTTSFPRVQPSAPASEVCDALAAPLDAGPCRCRSTYPLNESGKWAMPGGPHKEPDCKPAELASTLFVVRRGTRYVEGALNVAHDRIHVMLTVRGDSWKRFMSLNDK
jgi:hypothetical protein